MFCLIVGITAILSMPAVVSNAVSNRIPIRLCCDATEFFNTTSLHCEALPQDFDAATWEIQNFWSTGVGNAVNILKNCDVSVGMYCQEPSVFKFFDYNNDFEYCYSPFYHEQRQKFIIATLVCDFTTQMYTFIYDTYIYGVGVSSLFAVLTLVVFLNLKSLSHAMHSKLILCHVISWLCSYLLVIACICLMCTEMVTLLWFSFISSLLWLNVMAYEVWLQYSRTFMNYDLEGDRRFLLYSIYVWVITGISTMYFLIANEFYPQKLWLLGAVPALMSLATLLGFVCMAWKISTFRSGFVNTTKAKYFTRNSIVFLLGVFYLMVVSWIIFLLWLLYPRNVLVVGVFYVHLIAGGPILFLLFVPLRSLRSLCCKRFSDLDDRKTASMEEMQTFSGDR